MKYAFVCSPYRGDIQANKRRARAICREIMRCGYTPLAPHLYFSQFLSDESDIERQIGIRAGLRWLRMCAVMFVAAGPITEGMDQEIAEAQKLEIPIFMLDI